MSDFKNIGQCPKCNGRVLIDEKNEIVSSFEFNSDIVLAQLCNALNILHYKIDKSNSTNKDNETKIDFIDVIEGILGMPYIHDEVRKKVSKDKEYISLGILKNKKKSTGALGNAT